VSALPERYLIIVGAMLADLLLGEPPPTVHPVVWLGKAIDRIGWTARSGPRAQLFLGSCATLALVLGSAGIAAAASWATGRLPRMLRLPLEVLLLKTTFSMRSLVEAGDDMSRALCAEDLEAARRAARALVSREPGSLDHSLLASAAVESLAENLPDSILAPLLYYVVGGLPAAAGYRAANTLDAMIGYHGRFEYCGKLAARLDDVLSFLPARLAAYLIVAASALAGGNLRAASRTLSRDRGKTASPNAGWPMSAVAGALGVRLEKPRHYRLAAEAPAADVAAIDHAIQIIIVAVALAIPALLGVASIDEWRRGRRWCRKWADEDQCR
jgi:adenosylcobinamide-phosphate synthase